MSFRALLTASFSLLLCASATQASVIKFGTALAPTQSTATGVGWSSVEIDLDTRTMLVRAGFTGLRGETTAATLRGPTAEANTGAADSMTSLPSLTGFPLGVRSGTYEHSFDMTQASQFDAAFLNNPVNGGNVETAFNSLLAALTNDRAYLRIDTTRFPGGELSGFYKVVPPVPEPATLALAGACLVVRRRRGQ